MGYVLDECPTLHRCCACVPLRAGVLAVAVLGALWATAHLFSFSGVGALAPAAAPAAVAPALRLVHGVLGVLIGAAHVVLFAAALRRNPAMCELYVWSMALLWALAAAAAVVLAVLAAMGGTTLFAAAIVSLTFATILLSLYFTVVVANYRMTLP